MDEFKIHCGHFYATIVIDLSDGSVIYLAHGKKKQALEDFLALVGDEWMKSLEAVACDMNSNYEQVFQERYPNVAIVHDSFHIRKNFSDMVISEVRKDLQGKLVATVPLLFGNAAEFLMRTMLRLIVSYRVMALPSYTP